MSSKATNRAWTAPIDEAVEQARQLNKKAQRLAREAAIEVRTRSQAAIEAARKQSEEAARLVRKNLENAQQAIEEQRAQIGKLPEVARDQMRGLEERVRKGIESVAQRLNLVTDREFDGLRRKVSQLERRLGEVERHSRAA